MSAKRKGFLPEFWRRITRPELDDPTVAKRHSSALREVIKHDRRGDWKFFFRPSLDSLRLRMHVDLEKEVREKVNAAATTGKKICVADLGCGAGTALNELKMEFGDKIRTVGLVLARTHGEKYGGVDKLYEGDVSEMRMHEVFDFVFSAPQSAFSRSELPRTSLERILKRMRSGGKAMLYLNQLALPDELKTILVQNGVKKFEFRGNILSFTKPKSKLP